MLPFFPAKVSYLIFTHLKLCLATATHNFKWVKISHRLMWDQTFAVKHISLAITVVSTANKTA